MPGDPRKLRDLFQAASTALFNLHSYMDEQDDDWWKDVYRHRCELGHLIDSRMQAWSRETTPPRVQQP